MDPLSEEPRMGRLLQAIAFVASAAVAAGLLRFAWHEPLISAGLLAGMAAFWGGRWIARRRLRKLLRSGDVRSVLDRCRLRSRASRTPRPWRRS